MTQIFFKHGIEQESFLLHQASEKDFNDIIRLYQLCFSLSSIGVWSEESLLTTLNLTTTKVFLLTLNSDIVAQPIGFAVLQVVDEEVELLSIGIIPEKQNKGIGKLFLSRIKTQLQNLKYQKIFLEVNAENKTAIFVYKYSGFQILTKRIGYYRGENGALYDCLVMALNLK